MIKRIRKLRLGPRFAVSLIALLLLKDNRKVPFLLLFTGIATAFADTDVIGFFRGAKTCFAVLHYSDGSLAGKEFELTEEPVEEDAEVAQPRKVYPDLSGTTVLSVRVVPSVLVCAAGAPVPPLAS